MKHLKEMYGTMEAFETNIYVNNNSIGGNAINENSSAGTMGTTLDNKNHVLRYVYGV